MNETNHMLGFYGVTEAIMASCGVAYEFFGMKGSLIMER